MPMGARKDPWNPYAFDLARPHAIVVVHNYMPSAKKVVPYRNATLPAARRVKDLLSRMTLEEKAAQMMCVWQKKAETLLDADGNFDLAKAKTAFKKRHGLGQVGRPSDAGKGQGARGMAELTNAIQKFFLEHSRLGIPVIFHEECLHGHAARDGTSFPQPIGLGATFNPELVERLYAMTAAETRVRGAHQALDEIQANLQAAERQPRASPARRRYPRRAAPVFGEHRGPESQRGRQR